MNYTFHGKVTLTWQFFVRWHSLFDCCVDVTICRHLTFNLSVTNPIGEKGESCVVIFSKLGKFLVASLDPHSGGSLRLDKSLSSVLCVLNLFNSLCSVVGTLRIKRCWSEINIWLAVHFIGRILEGFLSF